MTNTKQRIVELCDAGKYASEIAAELNVSPGHVYRVLTKYRPDRPRKPRKITSELTLRIKALAETGVGAAEIAAQVGCSRANVYRVLAC